MSQLKQTFPELQLTIVGSGDLETELRQEVADRQLNVIFAGTASATEIREHLARSWLFVAPSITAQSGDAEGLGMVFLEAQALQTPVVSFRSGGLVEAVEEGVTALLSEEKDVAGLADNIARLLENSSLRHHMGQAGRERVEQHFDLRKQCAKLESIYAKLS
jgi:glycosyltransferase involved in cell wall biosynthesis